MKTRMNRKFGLAVFGICLAAAQLSVQARDITHVVPINTALQSELARARIDPSVQLFFGPQKHRQGETRGTGTSRGKEKLEGPDENTSCMASFLEAVQLLQRRARLQGANAVVNIASYYKNGPMMASETEFECHAGTNNTGVMLQGDFVRLPD
jgi:hypothetical protein